MTTRTRRALGILAAGTVALGLSAGAQAVALIDLGTGIIRDPSTNLEWLANANLAATMAFGLAVSSDVTPGFGEIGSTGRMAWYTAQHWIAGMNTANYLGHNDWRLPITVQPDSTCGSQSNLGAPYPLQGYGFNCTGSELGELFYNKLGGNQGESVLDTTGDTPEEIANLLRFGGSQSGNTVTGSTIQSYLYWSGTEYAPILFYAWTFYAVSGVQYSYPQERYFYAWAVRPGDVPLPGAGLLLLSALVGLGWAHRPR